MVNTDAEVTTKHFSKDRYDEAVAYQKSFVEKGVRFRKTNGETEGRKEVEIRRVTEPKPKRSASEFVSDKKQEYLSSHIKTQILMTNAQAYLTILCFCRISKTYSVESR